MLNVVLESKENFPLHIQRGLPANQHAVSLRGGDLRCELKGDRVLIGGQATLYKIGRAHV